MFSAYIMHTEKKQIAGICEIEKYLANKMSFWQLLTKFDRAAILKFIFILRKRTPKNVIIKNFKGPLFLTELW